MYYILFGNVICFSFVISRLHVTITMMIVKITIYDEKWNQFIVRIMVMNPPHHHHLSLLSCTCYSWDTSHLDPFCSPDQPDPSWCPTSATSGWSLITSKPLATTEDGPTWIFSQSDCFHSSLCSIASWFACMLKEDYKVNKTILVKNDICFLKVGVSNQKNTIFYHFWLVGWLDVDFICCVIELVFLD